jgi:hypothetical protein
MSKFIRFGDVLINFQDLVWVGVVIQNTTGQEVIALSFQFTNPTNNFSLRYADRISASSALSSFEIAIRSAGANSGFPPLPPLQS